MRRDIVVTGDGGVSLVLDHYPARGFHDGLRPVVWIRTPYGRKGMRFIAKRFTRAGAHVIIEAMRGTDGSGGVFVPFDVTPKDAAAVLGWLRAQPWFDGVIVTWGLSAIGYNSWGLAELDVPEWRAAILQDAPSELYGLIYPGGSFAGKVMLSFVGTVEWQAAHLQASMLRSLLASMRIARRSVRAAAEPPLNMADQRLVGRRVGYFQEWLARGADHGYWAAFDQRRKASAMPGVVHLATGWYDICLASTLTDFRALRAVGKHVRLTVGPWYHARGALDEALWSEWSAAAEPPTGAPVRVHVGGVQQWRDLHDWPPPGYRPAEWHLQPGGGLSLEPVPESTPDRYRYDPAAPTPSIGGAVENWDGTAGPKDNRKLEARPDVLTYTSDPLAADLTAIGPVTATVVFRSSLPHTDVVVRLCDVRPDGRSVNLCDGAQRLQRGYAEPAADGSRGVEVDLVGVAHVFRAGHRIRLQISSGAHPRLIRNSGTDEALATATELRAAEQEVFHDPGHVSVLRLPGSNCDE